MFDARSFLQQNGIPCSDREEHSRPGWLQIHCPFCAGSKQWHGGFNIKDGYYNCWRCGHHWIQDVAAVLLRISVKEAHRKTKPYFSGDDYQAPSKKREYVDKVKIKDYVGDLTQKSRQYLIGRDFDPDELIQNWGITGTNSFGQYKYRVFIPIYFNNQLISFQARDITDKSSAKYLTCPADEESYFHKHSLYGIDQTQNQKNLVVVEGVTGVWRLGAGAVATFGIKYTMKQVLMIVSGGFKKVFIFFDAEEQAVNMADKLSYDLSGFGVSCELITPLVGDSGSMNQNNADNLMRDLLT